MPKRSPVGLPALVRYQGRGLHGEVVDTIGRRIASGWYRPGDQLLCEALEAELQVSQTVVREALKALAAKGLVDSRPKRGTLVRPRDDWSLLDPDLLYWQSTEEPNATFLQGLAEVRSIIEPEAARLAAQRRTPADVLAIEDALLAMASAGNKAASAGANELVEADLAFHRALLAAAHNELLSRMEPVIGAGLRIRDQLVYGASRHPDAVLEHKEVAQAVRAGEADAAARATRRLLERSVEDATTLLEQQAATPRKHRANRKGVKTGTKLAKTTSLRTAARRP